MLFEDVAKYYEKLESVSSRLEMIDILTELFKKAKKEELKKLVYMIQGILAPPFEGIEIGMAEKLVEASISTATGFSKEEVEKEFKKRGDLGEAAEYLISKTKLKRLSQKKFELGEVFDVMRKIATTSGEGSQEAKIKMLAELLAASSPLEARYIVRFSLGTLRLGVGDATILEALSKLVTGERKFKEQLENAYNICSDLGKVADVLSREGIKGIENFKVELFSPIRPALAERLPTAEEILEKMHGKCAVESKYDGLRAQVHVDRKAKKVEIFSRRLERLTPMFPEIAKAALEEIEAENAIIEGEAIAYNEVTGEFHPFQETIQRKRKHGVEEMSQELPLHLFAFDLLYLNGEGYLDKPYHERRSKLEKIVKNKGTILLADKIVVTSPKELEKYFEEAIEKGLEGIVAKELNSRYIAGARKFSWIKMKRSYKGELSDTVDVVILGYYLGKGIRAEFGFGGLLCGVYNEKKDVFETVTKIGTGFTEEQMKEFRGVLEKIKVKNKPARVVSEIEPDFWVEPRYVVTVKADEITRSPTHTCGKEGEESGYALRFPRIVGGIRSDKGPEDATTTKEIIEMFKMQKKKKLEEQA
ncbi:MAG: ATP-dependent DNA ligase [Candidatus Micrarchaeia archaeon]|jgi:DNA ligase-1